MKVGLSWRASCPSITQPVAIMLVIAREPGPLGSSRYGDGIDGGIAAPAGGSLLVDQAITHDYAPNDAPEAFQWRGIPPFKEKCS